MYSETTGFTDKFGLGLTVGFLRMPALTTGPACVSGINKRNRNSRNPGLVADKSSEFIESPFAESFPLLFPYRCPEALEIFKGDASLGVFCNLNDFLCNGVISGTFEPSLSTREFFQMSFGRIRTLLLKCFSQCVNINSRFVHIFAGEGNSIGSCGDINNTKVNAKLSLRSKFLFIRKLNTQAKIEHSLKVQQISLSEDSSLAKLGIRTKHDRDFKSSIKAQNGNGIKSFKGKYALVIHNGRMFFKNMQPFFFRTVRFGNLAYSTNGKLSRKTVSFPYMVITKMVQANLSECLFFKRNTRNIVTGIVKHLNGFYQRALLFLCWNQFYFHSKFHVCIVPDLQYNVKRKKEEMGNSSVS